MRGEISIGTVLRCNIRGERKNQGVARGEIKRKFSRSCEWKGRLSRLHIWNVTSTSATECDNWERERGVGGGQLKASGTVNVTSLPRSCLVKKKKQKRKERHFVKSVTDILAAARGRTLFFFSFSELLSDTRDKRLRRTIKYLDFSLISKAVPPAGTISYILDKKKNENYQRSTAIFFFVFTQF